MTEKTTVKKTAIKGIRRGVVSKSDPDRRFRVEHWMKLPVLTVKPHDTVAHARALMEENRVNQLPVVVNGKLVGIVTDRDLRDAARAVEVSAAVATGKRVPKAASPELIPVEAVMTSKVFVMSPTGAIRQAADLMRRERIGGIPVLDRGKLAGIITRSDVLEAFISFLNRQ